ncbi:hypothetical protein IP92_05744 [Pseudoduganella flava]|uniref:Lysis protein n=1 Tax=Pseudoduganella flava TaxID=871742 RepID=A0A562P992_9BURK|nr:hypothetical protein [Pseudoduganella flava]QGZ42723.1 hypothetical protein GO485_29270 [Pseudoduganella flava]TWI41024.1 hypothetical protein IP92_05744 [Pseudoduganella flava]
MTPGQIKLAVCGAVLVVLLAGVGIGGYHVGANGVQAEWDRDKLEQSQAQERAVLAAIAANDAAHAADIESTKATLAQYKESLYAANERIAADRADAERDRLRIAIPARVCAASATGEAASPRRADAIPGVETVELPEATERRLRDLAESADREVAGLRAQVLGLQGWIRSHGFYEVGPLPTD